MRQSMYQLSRATYIATMLDFRWFRTQMTAHQFSMRLMPVDRVGIRVQCQNSARASRSVAAPYLRSVNWYRWAVAGIMPSIECLCRCEVEEAGTCLQVSLFH